MDRSFSSSKPPRREIPYLQPVPSLEETETDEPLSPKVSPELLDRLCSFSVGKQESEELEYLLKHNAQGLIDLVYALLERPVATELPIEEETFAYRRHLQELQRLRPRAYQLLNQLMEDLRHNRVRENQERLQPIILEFLQVTGLLLTVEKRKADWLEQEYFPAVYGQTVRIARSEVQQYLMRARNADILDEYAREPFTPTVHLKDELNYLMEGKPADSAGVYSHNRVFVRIPPWYTERDQWKVYLTTVHELVHSVSHETATGRVGLDDRAFEPGLESLNEAITQLVTFRIALEHLEHRKTFVQGQHSERLSMKNMPYSEYMIVVKRLFNRIPFSAFVDGMLNEAGWNRLRTAFTEVFGGEEAMISYAKKLGRLYKARPMRAFDYNVTKPQPETTKQNEEIAASRIGSVTTLDAWRKEKETR